MASNAGLAANFAALSQYANGTQITNKIKLEMAANFIDNKKGVKSIIARLFDADFKRLGAEYHVLAHTKIFSLRGT